MTCSSILGITLDVFSSPKSVRNYSSHQNRWGETCYIVVTNKMFFSVIKSVLKSSLNSVQSYRNKKIRVKNVTEFSEKNVIHREGRRSVHWIRWQKRKFTEFSDEFFTGRYSAHIWLSSTISLSFNCVSRMTCLSLKKENHFIHSWIIFTENFSRRKHAIWYLSYFIGKQQKAIGFQALW